VARDGWSGDGDGDGDGEGASPRRPTRDEVIGFSRGPSSAYRTYAVDEWRPMGYAQAAASLRALEEGGPPDEGEYSAYGSKTGRGVSASALVGSYGALQSADRAARERMFRLTAEKKHTRLDKAKKLQNKGKG
jgi:hypothetical protein